MENLNKKETLWRYKAVRKVDGNLTESKDSLGRFFARILKRKSFIANIHGEPDAGKSFTAASLCEDIDPKFFKDDIIGTLDRLGERIQQGGSVKQLDDFGSELDKYDQSKELSKRTNQLFQVIRTMRRGIFITTPTQMDINRDTRMRRPFFYIEVVAKNEKQGYNVVKVQRIRYNIKENVPYYHNLKMSPSGQICEEGKPHWPKISSFRVMKPTQALIDWYKPYRDELALQKARTLDEATSKEKARNRSVTEIKDEIAVDMSEYFKDGKINRARIRSQYGIGKDKVAEVIDLLDQDGLLKKRRGRPPRRLP